MVEFEIKEGRDYNLTLIYKDSVGAVVDITGASARLMARKSLYEAPVITKAAVITGAAGEILFAFTPTDTNGLVEANKELTCYKYDVEFTSATGKKDTLIEGNLTIKKPITRD